MNGARHLLLAAVSAAVLLGGCRDETGPGHGPPASLAVDADSARLGAPGDTLRLRAAVTDSRGTAVPDAAVTWRSSDTTVVAVSSAGLLRFDGVRWSVAQSGTTLALRGVWGTSATRVYAVGDRGLILEGAP